MKDTKGVGDRDRATDYITSFNAIACAESLQMGIKPFQKIHKIS